MGELGTAIIAYIHPGEVAGKFMQSVMDALFNDRHLLTGWIGLTSGPRIASARNLVVRTFLNHDDAPDWLVMVDSDMVFKPDAPRRLIERSIELKAEEGFDLHPVVGGLCFAGGRGSAP